MSKAIFMLNECCQFPSTNPGWGSQISYQALIQCKSFLGVGYVPLIKRLVDREIKPVNPFGED